LGARRYDFKDDDGGRVEGVTLHYLTLEGSDGSDSRGEIPFSCSSPPALYHQLEELPGMYEVDFRQRPGRGGKPTLQAVGVSYSGEPSFGAAQTA
jgi:hypothetical protein